ncbi:hypothetical protein OHA40_12905 [Nocardia sp. NBC_00508]|uniref:hypothetical protein n=1 Tax=Nocardia sp. NBC_00508 TaxID=2975992 RepID=UPI002E816D74|nr:hypothetical protein [Nocardia sp. NBC_00508]WUD68932.1 hypothetical protein OHA40_12905 [Nocardia sp. NBC_00508]
MATGVPRPAFTTELLADLHADNLTAGQREQLLPQVVRDAEALRFLRSLDEVSAELRALGRDERIIHPMPADVAARLTQLLDELDPPQNTTGTTTQSGSTQDRTAQDGATRWWSPLRRPANANSARRPASKNNGTAPDSTGQHAATPDAIRPLPTTPDARIHSLATASPSGSIGESGRQSTVSQAPPPPPVAVAGHRHRPGRTRWIAAAAAAILAVTAVGGVAAMLRGGADPSPTAAPTPPPTTGTDQLGEELSATVALAALGRHTVTGTLANPAALDRCVQANGLERTVLGSTDITFQSRNAVLILLTGPHPPEITALVVGTGCGTGDPQRRAVQDIG